MCANDVSARDWQIRHGGGQWCRGKSFDTFSPLGPCLVTAEDMPAGGHHVETVEASDATAAVVELREKLNLEFQEFEVVGVIEGKANFAQVDHKLVALAPYSPASP